ncbi:hypothetical protein H4582DRAFT_2056940 [Lactarius indigo]|nr:hypothetical protein H4582DRAFT_2056940 [Lactarius indigo]
MKHIALISLCLLIKLWCTTLLRPGSTAPDQSYIAFKLRTWNNIDNLPSALTNISGTKHYKLSKADAEWAALIPNDGTLYLGPFDLLGTAFAFDQRNCLDILKRDIIDGFPQEYSTYCLSSLIHKIMLCHMDLAVLGREFKADVRAEAYQCVDWWRIHQKLHELEYALDVSWQWLLPMFGSQSDHDLQSQLLVVDGEERSTAGLLQRVTPIQPVLRIAVLMVVLSRVEIATRVCLPGATHLKLTPHEISRLEREVAVAQRLPTEIIQTVLVPMMRDPALVDNVLGVHGRATERDTANVPVVGADAASRAVESESTFVSPLILYPWSAYRVVHALLHHHFYFPLQNQGEKQRPVVI